jgi:predicted dehydrogenase
LIGTGSIATSAHLPAITALDDLVELVAVSDIRTEIASAIGAATGAAVHADYRELLAREDVDAVDVCTPEFLHAEQVVAAAEAGKHVLCEKPIAASLADADAMIEACSRSGVRLMVAHSRRFTPRYLRLHGALDRIGEVRFFRENERRPSAFPSAPDDGVSVWTPRSDGESKLPWTRDAAYTRGAAMTNAVHEMDLMRWFVGREPEAVFAESRVADPSATTPDVITLLVRFEGGSIGTSESSTGFRQIIPSIT